MRQAFSRDVHQKSADAVAAYWQTAVFSGRDVPPAIAKSDAEVLAFVRANPGRSATSRRTRTSPASRCSA